MQQPPPDLAQPPIPPPPGGGAPADGPPPTPYERQARRRQRVVLIAVIVAAVILAVLVGIGVWFTSRILAAPDASVDSGTETTGESEDGDQVPLDGDQSPLDSDAEADLPHPDVAALDGADAVYGQLLIDVDESERTMIAFQRGVEAALRRNLNGDPERLFEEIANGAASRRVELLRIREDLAAELPEEGADQIRDAYLSHLDSWADLLEALTDDPTLLAQEEGTTAYDLPINTTAGAFRRTLENALPADIDDEVRVLAEGILDRGFRMSTGRPDV